jgi:hypothetical protein
MIVGTAISMVGSGLYLMLDLDTSRALWATFLVVCGLGTGFAINMPYTVVQAVLTLVPLVAYILVQLGRLTTTLISARTMCLQETVRP